MKTATMTKSSRITIITGIYNGEQMIVDHGISYPVPYNYSSKSKLIPGDTLKLMISENGNMTYKLIKSAKRKHIKGILHKKDNHYLALGSDNKNYTLNTAAVTFYKGQCGDEVCLAINEDGRYHHAALELIIKQ